MSRGAKSEDSEYLNCKDAIEYTKNLSNNHTKIVKNVILTPSHFKTCNNLTVILEQEYTDQLVTPFVIIEGELKICKNKKDSFNRDDPYFLKIQPTKINPILYQVMESIYTTNGFIDNKFIEEKTFKGGYLYINGNKLTNAIIEYTDDTKSESFSLMTDIENLIKRDTQHGTIILVPIMYYSTNSMCKIVLAVRKIILAKHYNTTIIDSNGDIIKITTDNTTSNILDTEEENITSDDQSLFRVN